MTFTRLPLVSLFIVSTALGFGCGSQNPAGGDESNGGTGDEGGAGGKAGAGGKGGTSGKGGAGGQVPDGSGGKPGAGGATAGSGGASEASGGTGPGDTPDAALPGSDGPSPDGPGSCPGPATPGQPRRGFPQHTGYPGCPTCIHPKVTQGTMDADVIAFYADWKKLLRTIAAGDVMGEYVVAAGAAGDINGWPAGVGPATQSEGHGYGMMILALMAGHDPMAKAAFDSMNRVRKAFPSSTDPRLMSWVVPKNGDKRVKPQPPATDGDMDMAYALLLAHDQWGDEAANHYLADARAVIAGMEAKFITQGSGKYYPRLNIGDPAHMGSGAPESRKDMTRPSDFIVDHMRAYAVASGHSLWMDLENGSLSILLGVRNPATGLVPDFVVDDPPAPSKTGTADENVCYACYDYNSCRVPWRQATAIALYGVAGSKDVANKIVAWARAKYKDDPNLVESSYALDGTGKGDGDNAFTSPMIAASIADPANQAWLDKGWAYMKGSSRGYYGGSITLMSMLVVSGNWWIPTAGAGGCE
jgi:endo-1,4-beta-D-glucanase Y